MYTHYMTLIPLFLCQNCQPRMFSLPKNIKVSGGMSTCSCSTTSFNKKNKAHWALGIRLLVKIHEHGPT